ncbi:MAG: hypothetical protein PWQ51_451 [Methanolobus sp.]|jgi:hypothetical protein|nr:hypothetical protein [Methanolobus sp.]
MRFFRVACIIESILFVQKLLFFTFQQKGINTVNTIVSIIIILDI